MSERVISDPTVAGWELNPDTGYWMWAAGGGSIQDGDTEGQITTWDGDEWTPEGAVVVNGGSVGIGKAPNWFPRDGRTTLEIEGGTDSSVIVMTTDSGKDFNIFQADSTGDVRFGNESKGTGNLTFATDNKDRMTIDAGGNVDVGDKIRLLANGRLYFNSTDGFSPFIREDTNDLAVWSGAAEVLRVGADGSVNITGKLFINGQEVTAGGGGGGGFWVEESPGVIKYTGTAKATDLVAG
jgi:hypothetical protein